MKLTPEEKEENKAYWIKSKSGGATAEGGEPGMEGEMGGGEETGSIVTGKQG